MSPLHRVRQQLQSSQYECTFPLFAKKVVTLQNQTSMLFWQSLKQGFISYPVTVKTVTLILIISLGRSIEIMARLGMSLLL